MKRLLRIGIVAATAAIALSACAQLPATSNVGAPGFLYGIIHGFTSLFALVGHAIGVDVRIYSWPNTGGWYDFGYVIGCGLFYGGAGSGT